MQLLARADGWADPTSQAYMAWDPSYGTVPQEDGHRPSGDGRGGSDRQVGRASPALIRLFGRGSGFPTSACVEGPRVVQLGRRSGPSSPERNDLIDHEGPLQSQEVLRRLEIDIQDLPNPLKPIGHRVRMHV
jgi:hypothetical protein